MPFFAWIFLFFAFNHDLVDQTFVVPANNWRYADLGLEQRSARVHASFEVESGPGVQMLVMERGDLDLLNRGETHGSVAATSVGLAGRLNTQPAQSGDLVVVLENRSGTAQPAKVRLKVSVDFVEAALVEPHRQLVVIAISLAVYFGIVAYSGRRLLRAVRLLQ